MIIIIIIITLLYAMHDTKRLHNTNYDIKTDTITA